METPPAPSRSRRAIWPACATLAIAWAGAMIRLGPGHPLLGAYAGSAAFSAFLAFLAMGLLPAVPPAGADETLRLAGSGGIARRKLAGFGLAVAAVLVYVLAAVGAGRGRPIPVLSPLIAGVTALDLPRGIDGTALPNFIGLAAVPILIMLASGARPAELGLGTPARGTAWAILLGSLAPMGVVAWGLGRGSLTVAALLGSALHSFLSNGFAEEFLARGLFLAALRRRLSNDVSNVLQALLFALAHVPMTISEERGDPLMIVANVFAGNVPLALAFGVLALRSRSLAFPTAIHVWYHVVIDTLKKTA